MRKTDPDNAARFNDEYWRENLARRAYYNPDITYDQYRLALEYGHAARQQYDPHIKFDNVAADLAAGWAAHQAATGLSWEEVKSAVEDAWQRGDEFVADAIANQGGFDAPPTFADHGRLTPRNRDEPGC
jgi:hypothetical protein